MVFLRSLSRSLQRPAASVLAARPGISRSSGPSQIRMLTATANRQGKVLMCLYDVSIPRNRETLGEAKQVL